MSSDGRKSLESWEGPGKYQAGQGDIADAIEKGYQTESAVMR